MKFGRTIVAFLLLAGIVANCFNYSIIASSYEYNKEYIAQVLCTNKDKPHLHCEGKCFLDIKLKELEKKNKQEQEHLKHTIETTAPAVANVIIQTSEVEIAKPVAFYLQQTPLAVLLDIFQPPKLG